MPPGSCRVFPLSTGLEMFWVLLLLTQSSVVGISDQRGFYESQVYSRRKEAGWGMCQQFWGDKRASVRVETQHLEWMLKCCGNRVFIPSCWHRWNICFCCLGSTLSEKRKEHY